MLKNTRKASDTNHGKSGQRQSKTLMHTEKKVLELKNKNNTTTDKAKQINYLACLPFFSTQNNRDNTFNLAQRNLEHTSIVK